MSRLRPRRWSPPLGLRSPVTAATAPAAGSGGGGYGDSGSTSLIARSYVNPDKGLPTFNADVDPGSGCARPDRYDNQRLSDPGTVNRNVHNDACFFEGSGDRKGRSSGSSPRKVDAPATFESKGAGVISACPDPDDAGPKYAMLKDRDGDGRADFCFQSGYQEKGMAGDLEFHARLNNTTTAGKQYVRWCYDPDRDGCSDERSKDRVVVNWTG